MKFLEKLVRILRLKVSVKFHCQIIIINKEVFDEPCTIHVPQLDNTESSKLVYVKRKTPLRKSLDLSTTSSAPFSHLFNVPLSNAVPTVTQHISTSIAATETISMLENQNIKIKKPRMSNNTKLSSLNVDNYMSDMAKIGAKIVTAGEKIATALNPTVLNETPLLESIGESLSRISTLMERFCGSTERIACALESVNNTINANNNK